MGRTVWKKYIQFTPEQIKQIAENFHNWQCEGAEQSYKNVPEYCYAATLDEVEAKGWSLVPSKYIEFVDRSEKINYEEKMSALQSELRELFKEEEKSRKEVEKVFKELGYEL